MSQHTVLVIDDSATIRRLVDTSLSPVGYAVLKAPSAEEGVATAIEHQPDVIILDHQLPGTTGIEVCTQLLRHDETKNIPVVASSTLRNKAYVEYAECPNVVDMLPKPYTAELLVTMVANVLDTATMVVGSQRDGTAVPEVVDPVGEVALSGEFRKNFTLRQVLDFLNNANQSGVLEVEESNRRAWIFVDRGRVQAVTASGLDTDAMIDGLPESLQDLGPVLRLTVGGGSCTQIEGLVQLLDTKVLDPRLLQKLLRHQAAAILLECFQAELSTFRFETDRKPPALHGRLPLEISVVALLVEGCGQTTYDPPEYNDSHQFCRRAIRGQNLDRAGLSAAHQKLLSQLGDPLRFGDIVAQAGGNPEDVARALHGLVLADLIEQRVVVGGRKVAVVETDPKATVALRSAAKSSDCPFDLKVVRDKLSLDLVLKRHHPEVVVLPIDSEFGSELLQAKATLFGEMQLIGIGDPSCQLAGECELTIPRPYTVEQLFESIKQAGNSELAPVG